MKAAIYNISSCEILRLVAVPHAFLDIQCQDGEEFFLGCPPGATHIINGQPITIIPEPVPPTLEELTATVVNAVQRHLDATARSRNYDGILSLCRYATSTDPVFSAEGAAGVAWRDACWRTCYQGMTDVQAQLRPMPTPEEAVAELPVMVWPS